MKKYIFTLLLMSFFSLANGMGAGAETPQNLTVLTSDGEHITLNTHASELLLQNSFFIVKQIVAQMGECAAASTDNAIQLDITAENLNTILDCLDRPRHIEHIWSILEEKSNHELKTLLNDIQQLGLPFLIECCQQIIQTRPSTTVPMRAPLRRQGSAATTQMTRQRKTEEVDTQAADDQATAKTEGSEMELLEFKGKTEADITKMVAQLMLETIPTAKEIDCLDDNSTTAAYQDTVYEGLTPAEALKMSVEYQLNPEARRRISRVFRLMHKTNKKPLFIDNTTGVLAPEALRELDVLVGSGDTEDHKAHSLASKIKHTQLTVGYATLMRHLAQVKTPQNLHEMQRLVAQLDKRVPCPETSSNQSILRTMIRDHIADLNPIEDTFLSLWAPDEGIPDPLWEEVIKGLTSRRPALKKEIQTFRQNPTFDNFKKAFPFVSTSDATKAFTQDKTLRNFKKAFPFVETTPADSLNLSCKYMELRQLAKFGTTTLGPLASIVGSIVIAVKAPNFWSISNAVTSVPLGIVAMTNIPDELKVQAMGLWLMQRKLVALAKFTKKIDKLRAALEAQNFPKELTDQLRLDTASPEMAKLQRLIQQDSFETEEVAWKHFGRILVAYRCMLRKRNEYLNAYAALGTIDMLSSISELLNQSTRDNPYCLAQYGKENGGIQASACWSPLLKGQRVVTNDVAIGGQNPGTLIITGPNARGKTTLMRSVGGAALLASTLGIGSAESLTIPPNLDFLTSVNIGDDPCNQLSLFQSLVRRMSHLMTTLEQRSRDGRPCLVVADEPFVGTDNMVSEVCASIFIEEVARMNPLALFSSHLKVSHLAEKYRYWIANYHLNDYHLLPGIDTDREKYLDIAIDEVAGAFGSSDHPFVARIRSAFKLRMQTGDEKSSPSSDAQPMPTRFDSATPHENIQELKASIERISERVAQIHGRRSRILGKIEEDYAQKNLQREKLPALISGLRQMIPGFEGDELSRAKLLLEQLIGLAMSSSASTASDDESEGDYDEPAPQRFVRSQFNQLFAQRKQSTDREERRFLRQQIKDAEETFRRLTELSDSSSDDE